MTNLFDVIVEPAVLVLGGEQLLFAGHQLGVDLSQAQPGLFELDGERGRWGHMRHSLVNEF